MNDYVPYGPEWEKEMHKLPKKVIIDFFRTSQLKIIALEDLLRFADCPPLLIEHPELFSKRIPTAEALAWAHAALTKHQASNNKK